MRKPNNLLKINFPNIFNEIDREETHKKYPNVDLDNLTCGSNQRIIFKCPKCGNHYEYRVYTRTSGHGCPFCNGKYPITGVNDLQTLYPDIAKEYSIKNKIPVNQVSPKGDRLYIWNCPNGHEYTARVSDRTLKHSGCNICSNRTIVPGINDLKTWILNGHQDKLYLLKEWDYTKNEKGPENYSPYSDKIIYWKCQICGGVYPASIARRNYNNSGCPYCSGRKVLPGFNDLKTKYPEIAELWDYDKNYPLTPDKITYGSGKKVYWICPRCGQGYRMSVNAKTCCNAINCPHCNYRNSIPELIVYEYIKEYVDINAVSDYFDKFELDIFIQSLNIGFEYDGAHWHNDDKAIDREKRKNLFFADKNIKIFRIKETKDINNKNKIITKNNVTIYYLYFKGNYSSFYFNEFNKIIEDIIFKLTSKKIKADTKSVYKKVKLTRNST